jgi:hypothetical protein
MVSATLELDPVVKKALLKLRSASEVGCMYSAWITHRIETGKYKLAALTNNTKGGDSLRPDLVTVGRLPHAELRSFFDEVRVRRRAATS